MASEKRTTKVLRTSRDRTVAYARKQKPPTDGSSDDATSSEADSTEDAASDDKIEGAGSSVSAASDVPIASDAPAAPALAAPAPAAPAPAATPVAAPAIDSVQRARTETIKMPVMTAIGMPPAMPPLPKDAAPSAAAADTQRAEDPTSMPGPREIPTGRPDDPARPPGLVPSGDSRSMRRRADVHEFALIYRRQTFVISRFGVVGTRGQWRVVEYPTSAAASHAYAKECSRFVSDGFSDYREWSGV
jgi:hypothetical protein